VIELDRVRAQTPGAAERAADLEEGYGVLVRLLD
jgi:hypothetical protein